MSKANGWICLHRKMMDTSWYGNPTVTVLAVHLLLSASHKDKPWNFGTRHGTLLRGQLVTGRKVLARQLGLSEWQVQRALKVLRDANFCTQEAHNWYSVITICNYNAYQSSEPDSAQQFAQQDTTNRTPTPLPTHTRGVSNAHKTTKNKLTNNNNIVIKFDELWNDYPRKIGKKAALRHFKASCKTDEDFARCKQALINYNNSKYVKEGEFIKHGSTWFNQWEDWVTDPDRKSGEIAEMEELLRKERGK